MDQFLVSNKEIGYEVDIFVRVCNFDDGSNNIGDPIFVLILSKVPIMSFL